MLIAEGQLDIRVAGPDDARAVREFLERLSPDSRWLRYHAQQPRIRAWMVDAVAGADHDRRDAIVAELDGKIVGVAEWGRMPGDERTADIAVVVEEGLRRRGIARALLRGLAESGRSRGISTFVASILTVNRPTLALVHRLAPERKVSFDGATVSIEVPLSA